MSTLGLLNFLVLQWFGVRLQRCEVVAKRPYWTTVPPDRFAIGDRVRHAEVAWSIEGRIVETDGVTYRLRWYKLLRWVWPLTGWWSDYRWIARR